MTPFLSRRDLAFNLYELLDVEALTSRERYRELSREVFDDTINLAYQIAEKHFAPHAREADLNEPRVEGGKVRLVPGAQAAVNAFRDAGFFAAHHDEVLGGLQLPWVVFQAAMANFQAANIATTAYPFLTIGNANLQRVFASPEQQARFMRPLIEGRWFGTMALSEPQAGSALADITTTATPRGDGTYSLTGTKMWISGGEHELAENIVHLVLARIKGAPAGVKGISLFLVPRYRVNADGTPGEDNHVVLAGLNHKLGYRGTTNTLLNFGEGGETVGELVGAPGSGLASMFHMMNEARIGVGMGATMLGYAGYLYSLEYARERLQGRSASQRDPASPPVPIVQHADVRRMLLAQKAAVEGAFALGLYCARLVDDTRTAESDEAREHAQDLLDLLTPIMKAWPSKYALEANDLAIQVLGGAGYTRDHPVEQLWRDNRLNPIHEGTNGIQALDLQGRKITQHDGRGLTRLLAEFERTADEAQAEPVTEGWDFTYWATQLRDTGRMIADLTAAIARKAAEPGITPERLLANADAYLDLMGHTVIAWTWLRQGMVAARALRARPDGPDADFYRGKLQACRYFFARELPRTGHWQMLVRSFDPSFFDMQDPWF